MMNLPTVLPPPSVISSPSPSSDWIDRVSGVLLFFQRKLRNGDLLRVSDLPRCFSLAVLLRRDPNAVSYDYTRLYSLGILGTIFFDQLIRMASSQ